MATTTIRKAIGVVKDHTSTSLARVAGSPSPDLDVLVLKATSHDEEPADGKYVRQILNMLWNSDAYVQATVSAISKRLNRTHDWIVALKALMLVHQLLSEGETLFAQHLMMVSNRKGVRILDLSGFRDDAHSNSWDLSRFVRRYSVYLDRKLEVMVQVKNENKESEEDGENLIKEMQPERVFPRVNQWLHLLVRFIDSKPTGAAENSKLVLIAMEMLLRDSFRLYNDVSGVLKIWLDCFSEMDYSYCTNAFDAYIDAAKIVDDLIKFYTWCNGIELMRPSDFPQVQRIGDELLGELEALLRDRRRENRSRIVEEMKEPSMNDIRALPPPENWVPETISQPPQKSTNQQVTEDLVDLKTDAVEEINKMTLALFSAPGSENNKNSKWVDFSTEEDPKTSAWENPAAETDKANWELLLVDTTSNLSNHKAEFTGGFDILLLNGIYDQGTATQHINNSYLRNGSASSVALPGTTQNKQLLALPAPDGSFQPVAPVDPFAASLVVPPPAYVQIADMERKQQLLLHEQMLWQQYANTGMQGEVSFAKISGLASYHAAGYPHGVPNFTGLEQPGSYHYPYL